VALEAAAREAEAWEEVEAGEEVVVESAVEEEDQEAQAVRRWRM
jgi:hypothetical protein